MSSLNRFHLGTLHLAIGKNEEKNVHRSHKLFWTCKTRSKIIPLKNIENRLNSSCKQAQQMNEMHSFFYWPPGYVECYDNLPKSQTRKIKSFLPQLSWSNLYLDNMPFLSRIRLPWCFSSEKNIQPTYLHQISSRLHQPGSQTSPTRLPNFTILTYRFAGYWGG